MLLITDSKRHFTSENNAAVPIRFISKSEFPAFLEKESAHHVNLIKAQGFDAKLGKHCLLFDENGHLSQVLYGAPEKTASKDMDEQNAKMGHGQLARLLPAGDYILADESKNTPLAHLAWAMGGYSFDRYKKRTHNTPRLVVKNNHETQHLAETVFLVRDLINIPANDMGPIALEDVFHQLGESHGVKTSSIVGDELLEQNFPMVHAVGRASAQAPRVLNLTWGDESHPKVTLVGKGVTFDTGGLNIKPGSSMALMKKDMGGAAHVIGLAHSIMAAQLPVRLRLIVGAVENSISGNAFRPGDILSSRKGLSVEIGNTDAEGRLVLGDCLAWADEEKPDLIIDMATLTGAARVALGPEVSPFYTYDDDFAGALSKAGQDQQDPLWRMPLWGAYQSLLSSKIAEVNHISSGGFGGSITAALFLSRFVEHAKIWSHFDIYGWAPAQKPWTTVGGEAQAIRALFETLKNRYGTKA